MLNQQEEEEEEELGCCWVGRVRQLYNGPFHPITLGVVSTPPQQVSFNPYSKATGVVHLLVQTVQSQLLILAQNHLNEISPLRVCCLPPVKDGSGP